MVNEYQDIENSIENNGQISSDEIAVLQTKIEDLQRRISDLENEVITANDKSLRMAAEADNTRKRAAKDVEHARAYGIERFAKEIIIIMDSFELGLKSVAGLEDAAAKNFAQGMQMTHQMLISSLEKFNIMLENPVGAKFDPKMHEALSIQESTEFEPGYIINVLQPGFVMMDRVLRPARVVVSKAAATD